MVTVERRKHARFPFERHLEVWAADRADPLVVRAHDISAGGFSFWSEQQLVIGSQLVLGLRDIDDFLVKALVRSVRPVSGGWLIGAERVESA
jgi:hypothetical protein